jgi:hypothetical protein
VVWRGRVLFGWVVVVWKVFFLDRMDRMDRMRGDEQNEEGGLFFLATKSHKGRKNLRGVILFFW